MDKDNDDDDAPFNRFTDRECSNRIKSTSMNFDEEEMKYLSLVQVHPMTMETKQEQKIDQRSLVRIITCSSSGASRFGAFVVLFEGDGAGRVS